MKKILFATSEAVPFVKTGGLADVAGSLPKYFNKKEYDVRVMLPKYLCIKEEWRNKMEYVTHFYMDWKCDSTYVGVLKLVHDGITSVSYTHLDVYKRQEEILSVSLTLVFSQLEIH